MSIIKAIIGMIKWKKRMQKLADQPSYTDEWWAEVTDACEFMPKEQREGFVNSYVTTTLQF